MTAAVRRDGAASALIVGGVLAVGLLASGGASPSRSDVATARVIPREARGATTTRAATSARSPTSTTVRARHVLTHPSAKYGGIPSWLPRAKVPVGRIVQASRDHPALAIQGDTVSVHLTQGRTLATTVGPVVREEGRFSVPATSPCSFSVSLAAGHGIVPIRRRAFTILDELGHVHHPRVVLSGGGPLPARLAPGHIVTLSVSAVLPTGGGRLRWAPTSPRPLVSWDFDVEID